MPKRKASTGSENVSSSITRDLNKLGPHPNTAFDGSQQREWLGLTGHSDYSGCDRNIADQNLTQCTLKTKVICYYDTKVFFQMAPTTGTCDWEA